MWDRLKGKILTLATILRTTFRFRRFREKYGFPLKYFFDEN